MIKKIFIALFVLANSAFAWYAFKDVLTPAQKTHKHACGCTHHHDHNDQRGSKHEHDTHHHSHVSNIAVLVPTSNGVVDTIVNGFKKTLAQNDTHTFQYTTYDANGNRTLMRSQVEEIIDKEYDLILSVGTLSSLMTKEITMHRKCSIPIVFCAVSDPEKLNLVQSLEKPGSNVTGVDAGTHQFDRQVDVLCTLKPDMKNVLFVYDPNALSGKNEKYKQEIETLLNKRGKNVRSIEIFATNELSSKLPIQLENIDALFVLRDATVLAGIDVLVRYCNRHGITLFASDFDSVSKGAACGFAASDEDTGIAAAKKVEQILIHHKLPQDIPVSEPDYQFKLVVNRESAVQQNLIIPDAINFMIENSVLV